MSVKQPQTKTFEITDTRQRFSQVLNHVSRTRTRVLIEESGRPIAAIVPAEDLQRLNLLDAEWEEDFKVFDEMSSAFDDVSLEEIEHETAKALTEVRADMRAEWEGTVSS